MSWCFSFPFTEEGHVSFLTSPACSQHVHDKLYGTMTTSHFTLNGPNWVLQDLYIVTVSTGINTFSYISQTVIQKFLHEQFLVKSILKLQFPKIYKKLNSHKILSKQLSTLNLFKHQLPFSHMLQDLLAVSLGPASNDKIILQISGF